MRDLTVRYLSGVFSLATVFAMVALGNALACGCDGHETVGYLAASLIAGSNAEQKVNALLHSVETLATAAEWPAVQRGSSTASNNRQQRWSSSRSATKPIIAIDTSTFRLTLPSELVTIASANAGHFMRVWTEAAIGVLPQCPVIPVRRDNSGRTVLGEPESKSIKV